MFGEVPMPLSFERIRKTIIMRNNETILDLESYSFLIDDNVKNTKGGGNLDFSHEEDYDDSEDNQSNLIEF